MVLRTPASYLTLLKEQYSLLKDAVESFYQGNEAKAIEVAARIRTLVHGTASSTPLLSYVDSNYLDLTIYHRPSRLDSPKAVFVLKQPIQMTGDGKSRFIRNDFSDPTYQLVPLSQWWTEGYLVIGGVRSSKKQVVLDIANKDGGAHVDSDVPARHVAASSPPFAFGVNQNFVQPNLARSTVV